jgi:hypothetical protein
MYFLGSIFAVLWMCAFYIGRKGEAIRATLVANPPTE